MSLSGCKSCDFNHKHKKPAFFKSIAENVGLSLNMSGFGGFHDLEQLVQGHDNYLYLRQLFLI